MTAKSSTRPAGTSWLTSDPDAPTKKAIGEIFPGWNGNREIVRARLRNKYSEDEVDGFDWFRVRMEFNDMLLTINRHVETVTATVGELRFEECKPSDYPAIANLLAVDGETPIVLTKDEIAILRYLAKTPGMAVKQSVLAALQGDERLGQSAKTIGVNIQRLRELGLTVRACGDRSGEAITQKGLAWLKQNTGR